MGGRGRKAVANTPELSSMSSDDPIRIAARLKRDRPDLAEAVERGEIPTIRQAGEKVLAGHGTTRILHRCRTAVIATCVSPSARGTTSSQVPS